MAKLLKDEKATFTELKDIPISPNVEEVDWFGWGGRWRERDLGCNCHSARIIFFFFCGIIKFNWKEIEPNVLYFFL